MQVARVRVRKTFTGDLISEELTILGDESVSAYVKDLAVILAPVVQRHFTSGGGEGRPLAGDQAREG